MAALTVADRSGGHPPSLAAPPGFVYAITVSLFAFSNVFAVILWPQYRPGGQFAEYLLGERASIVLSLVARSALARQVLAGTLAA